MKTVRLNAECWIDMEALYEAVEAEVVAGLKRTGYTITETGEQISAYRDAKIGEQYPEELNIPVSLNITAEVYEDGEEGPE